VTDHAVRTCQAAAPALRPHAHSATRWNAFSALRLRAAVNLAEDRRFRDQPVHARLESAISEQRAFLNAMLDPAAEVVYDLRLITRPENDSQLEVGVLIRAWADTESAARHRVSEVAQGTLRGAPDHVVLELADEAALELLLEPLGAPEQPIHAAFVTRDEVVGAPVRPDVKQEVSYHYSVLPWDFAATDWSPFYARLSRLKQPLVLSVALLPQHTDPELAKWLETYATRYQQWASPDRLQGAIYSGDRALPPEAFAVDAAPTFMDYAQRLRTQSFLIRIMLASPEPLPAGLAQALGATVSSLASHEAGHLEGRRAAAGFELRDGLQVSDLARWDLRVADVCVPDGDPDIWAGDGAPPTPLAALPVVGDARDAACAFRLPIAHTGDLPGVRVRRGRIGQAEAAFGGERPLLVGELYDGSGQLLIDADSLSKHALVAGSTGSGKTTIVLELLRQLWTGLAPQANGTAQRIPFLVIEPVNSDANDYRKLGALPGFEDLEIYTVGDERFRPLRFNPFAVPDGVLVGEHMAALLECFKAAFGLWDPLPAIYEEALAETYLSQGVLPGEVGGEVPDRQWPTVVHFRQAMGRATKGLGYAGEVKANLEAASVIRAKQLVFGAGATTFRTNLPLDIERLMGRPVILELKSLGSGDEQALMIALILSAITEHYKATRGAQAQLQHVTVVEEAHRLLGRAKGAAGSSTQAQAKEQAAEAFANVLAENRKYGEGVVIAEQIPSKLVEDAVKNTNLKVMCRLTSEEERTYLGEAMAMMPEQMPQAARLTTGQALIYSDELPNATEVAASRTITGEIPGELAVDRRAPMAACVFCPQPCQHRATGLALSRRPLLARVANEALELLRQPKPSDPAQQRQRRKNKRAIPPQLARAALAEAARYPALQDQERRQAAATCAVVHLLDGAAPIDWTRLTAEKISNDSPPEQTGA
jgi:Helicase HerA, central domain